MFEIYGGALMVVAQNENENEDEKSEKRRRRFGWVGGGLPPLEEGKDGSPMRNLRWLKR